MFCNSLGLDYFSKIYPYLNGSKTSTGLFLVWLQKLLIVYQVFWQKFYEHSLEMSIRKLMIWYSS